jgi:hypothetical protein
MLPFSCLGIPVLASLKRKLCLAQCGLPAKAASSGVKSIVNFHLPGTGVKDDCVVLKYLLFTECMQGRRDGEGHGGDKESLSPTPYYVKFALDSWHRERGNLAFDYELRGTRLESG